MKIWFKMLVVAMAAFTAVGCTPQEDALSTKLEVTANGISGEWKLVSFASGQKPAEGSYVYLDIKRKDREFVEYQNIDNPYGTVATGRYYIYEDAEHGAVIRGEYDNSVGDWTNRYKVTLYEREMVWTALDDETEVCVYERCSIPEEIKIEEEE